MIRVLLIAPTMDILGGHAVQAEWLQRGFENDREVEMSFLPMNPRLPGPLRRVKYVRTILTALWFQVLLLGRIRRVDVLHVFAAGFWSFLLAPAPAIVCGLLLGKNVVLHYHDGRLEDHLKHWRTAKLMKLAHRIVTPSEYLVGLFASYGYHSEAIYNVIDAGRFIHRRRGRLRPRFLTNRMLDPLYNVACTLRAFAVIQQRFPEASLDVAHDGPSRPELERLAGELGLRNTRFLGKVAYNEVPGLYDRADIYIMSPNADCMPCTILECFASGLPVVTTDAGGIPYMAEDGRTALLVPCGDDRALAAAALRLLEDPALVERMTSQARDEVERYGWPKIRGQWLALYQELSGR